MSNQPQRELDDELVKYDSIVTRIVWNARAAFLRNRERGKAGWDHPRAWEDQKSPLDRAVDEIEEVRGASTRRWRLEEAGDALNFLAFDFAVFDAQEEA